MTIDDQYVDGEYARKNPGFHTEDSGWKATQVIEGLQRAHLSPSRVAEVGCGAGKILAELAQSLPQASYVGYELSPQGFAMCEQHASDDVTFLNMDVFSDDRTFDVMLCMDVFEHIEDYFAFLRGLTQKADHFIFHIPLDMNAQMVAREQAIMYVRDAVGHLHYFSKETALATLDDCGYQVIDWFYTSSGRDLNKSRKAKLLRWPRSALSRVSPGLTARLLGGFSLLVVAQAKAD